MNVFVRLGFFLLMATGTMSASAQTAVTFENLAFTLHQSAAVGAIRQEGSTLLLTARKGTDLYTSPDGTKRADATPRMLFIPSGDFILTAKVTATFAAPFDGAALLVYADSANWAKLLFERGRTNSQAITTTVAKQVGDDAHHGAREGSTVYLKVARRQLLYVFYTSHDGNAWQMVRNFSLPSAAPVHVGFSAQSPIGDEFAARFSEISYRAITFKDFWRGE